MGHSGGSFAFRYVTSMLSGMKDMLNVMSKFLNMGISLDDIIAKSTWAPTREIRREELGLDSYGEFDRPRRQGCVGPQRLTRRRLAQARRLQGQGDPRWDGMLSETVRARK